MRQVAKILANQLSLVVIFPVWLSYLFAARMLGASQVFPGFSQAVSLIPGLSGAYLRRAWYRLVLPRCGPDSFIAFGSIFSHPSASIGTSVYVGSYCVLGDVVLEDDVLLGSAVSIMNGTKQHGIERLDVPVREQPGVWPKVTIGQDTWIGDRAVVMADVGQHCVVGAAAVVTRPLPDYAIAVGNPASIVRYRNESPHVIDPNSATLEK